MTRAKKGSKKSKANEKPKVAPRKSKVNALTPPSKSGGAVFTLRDAARESGNRSALWATNSAQLRHKAISFVSGGATGASLDRYVQGFPEKREAADDVEGEEVVEEEDEEGEAEEEEEESEDEGDNDEPEVAGIVRGDIQPTVSAPLQHSTQEAAGEIRESVAPQKVLQRGESKQTVLQGEKPKQNLKDVKAPIDGLIRQRETHQRPSSPTPSNSSEDVVVFAGRNRSNPQSSKKLTEQRAPDDSAYHSASQQMQSADCLKLQRVLPGQVTYRESQEPHLCDEHTMNEKTMSAEDTIFQLLKDQGNPVDQSPDSIRETQLSRPRKRHRKRRKGRPVTQANLLQDETNSQDEVLDDYINNLVANGEIGSDRLLQEPHIGTDQAEDAGWGYTELEDFADISTSNEVHEVVTHVLSRRERSAGLQYLVVWEGQTPDEARWIHHERLVERRGADPLIMEFEEKRAIRLWNEAKAEELAAAADSSDLEENKVVVGAESSADDVDEYNEMDDSEGIDESTGDEEDLDTDDLPMSDEEDLIQRRNERMTDEHLARLLQHQEELGMDADELALFDGEEDDLGSEDIYPYVDKFYQSPSSRALLGRSKKTKRKMMGKLALPRFDGALDDGVVGDDYGTFDVTDWGRPSLGTRSRHRLDIAALQLDDSDLERQLKDSWAADKQKKKDKKIEREQLREEGLLGGAGKKANKSGSTKRANGLSIDEFEDELQDFLNSERQLLALPPMDKKLRKFVHEIANKFGLKSKSKGSGNNRFPVLSKTARTKRFDTALFDSLSARFSRRFGVLGGGSQRGKVPKAWGGKGESQVADGALVGAGAKEIGLENKGRAMLEKMGWSKGTALGALDNKGILMPIDSVMKKTRAGLG